MAFKGDNCQVFPKPFNRRDAHIRHFQGVHPLVEVPVQDHPAFLFCNAKKVIGLGVLEQPLIFEAFHRGPKCLVANDAL